ncbi:MAG: SufE family protein [Cyclobacteriaceae bacterium]
MMAIAEKQASLVEEFQLLDGDMEMTLHYIMELGNELPELSEEKRTEDNIVKGCQSKVWMSAEMVGDHLHFEADSNTAITKGLVSMLLKVVNDERPEDVLNTEIDFPSKIGMNRFIGTQRSNGFAAMMKQIKYYALALSQK